MTFNLDNSCYGKLKLSYNKENDFYSINGDNRGVTFNLGEDYDLFFADSVHHGKLYIGKAVDVDLQNQSITLEDGITIELKSCDYFGRGY